MNKRHTVVVALDMPAGLLLDLRDACRSLRQAPWFTTVAVVTLAAGLGLCIVLLTLANAWLLAPLPYPEADRLYTVQYGPPGSDTPDRLETLRWDSLGDVAEALVAWDLDVFTLRATHNPDSGPESAPGAWVTPGFVAALGVRPALGRSLAPADFEPGRPPVALISHRLWVRRFASDPQIVGRQFQAYVSDRPNEAETFTIAGVLPRDLWHINSYTDVIAPLRAPFSPYQVRLRRGVSPTVAAERFTALVRNGLVHANDASLPPDWRVTLTSTQESYTARIRPMFRAVGVASALVLLMACANVAVLQLLRAHRRQRELAIRLSLGSSYWRLARLVTIEALLVSACATAIGIGVGRFAAVTIAPIVERQTGRTVPGGLDAVALDGRVVAGAAALGIVTVLLCALAPLVASRRAQASALIGAASRTSTDGVAARRARHVLIALEAAASIALLSSALLMGQTVRRLLQTEMGYSAEGVQTASIGLRERSYPDAATRAVFYERLLSRMNDMPDVASAALVDWWPLQPRRPQRVEAAAPAGAPAAGAATASAVGITASYFDTLRIPILSGRAFSDQDRLGSPPVAIVSRALAARLWPQGAALGQSLRLHPPNQDETATPPVDLTIVGIVGDVRQGAADTELSDLYRPLLQQPGRFAFVHARVRQTDQWEQAMARAVSAIDPDLPLGAARPLLAAIELERARPSFLASLLGVFALPSALLALLGLHAAVAYTVRQREREIAIRMALGAQSRSVMRLFVTQGAWTLAAGAALGIPAAMAMGRLLESELFGVRSAEPGVLALGAAVFVVCGLIAVWNPARRASRTDPAVALRSE